MIAFPLLPVWESEGVMGYKCGSRGVARAVNGSRL